jgi:hypothetical protein
MKKALLLGIAFAGLLLATCFSWPAALQARSPLQVAAKEAKGAKSAAVTTPKEHFGFNMGDDYCLANYQQLKSYWHKIEQQTDRLKVVKIGDTEEGRPQLMGIVTSPANHKKLAHYQEISRRMALAADVSAAEAARLAEEGKAVIWIDGGLHANEVLCAQMLIETLYQFVTASDAETMRILDDVIILFVHANPDGMDLVADHYMRNKDPKQRSIQGLPRLYQKYIGHDNNRDFYANTQAETKNMNKVMYHEWLPQIVYNHHQSGPQGTVLFCPPFKDPHNYNIDPLVINGIDRVGAAMMERFLVEGKAGATVRSGAPYSGWWNGGLRTTCTFHNMIGLLTETIGSPTPMQIPFLPNKQLSKGDYLAPIAPQAWHFRQSVDYSVTANKAVLDYASRNRQHLLHNIWLMGKNAIDHGNRDSWTITPKMVDAAKGASTVKKGAAGPKEFQKFFNDPTRRDPRGYVLPADQPDFLTATKFMSALRGTGITVHRAKSSFDVAGKKYPQGSYVVKAAQPFRSHLIDMFEPQDHPNDFAYPGAPPTKPYDSAGWTLAFQMGVQFDRILEGFDGPFEEIKEFNVAPPPAVVKNAEGVAGYFLSCRTNDSFRAVNQLLKAGEQVRRLTEECVVDGVKHPAGSFYIAAKPATKTKLDKIAAELGTGFVGSKTAPGKEAVALKPVKIGLWDSRGGSMPSGWTRWLLERFDYDFNLVFATELESTKLRDKYDALVFVDGAPTENFADTLSIFLKEGGTVLSIGNATAVGKSLGVPFSNHVQAGKDKYYVPTSVLQVKVDNKQPLAWGMPEKVDVTFNNSPTFKLPAGFDAKGITRVAWFDSKTPLRSGWAYGQEYLEGGTAIIDAKVGKGRLVLFGPQILFRGQPHGTFKFLFNGLTQAAGER